MKFITTCMLNILKANGSIMVWYNGNLEWVIALIIAFTVGHHVNDAWTTSSPRNHYEIKTLKRDYNIMLSGDHFIIVSVTHSNRFNYYVVSKWLRYPNSTWLTNMSHNLWVITAIELKDLLRSRIRMNMSLYGSCIMSHTLWVTL